jgi:hypothetical protein
VFVHEFAGARFFIMQTDAVVRGQRWHNREDI